ncbi:MAG: hypothetical protein K940chlam3_00021 [Chlamydiae bacterium]|nr:hypothetical protein [Chlamydiota bacterium]
MYKYIFILVTVLLPLSAFADGGVTGYRTQRPTTTSKTVVESGCRDAGMRSELENVGIPRKDPIEIVVQYVEPDDEEVVMADELLILDAERSVPAAKGKRRVSPSRSSLSNSPLKPIRASN